MMAARGSGNEFAVRVWLNVRSVLLQVKGRISRPLRFYALAAASVSVDRLVFPAGEFPCPCHRVRLVGFARGGGGLVVLTFGPCQQLVPVVGVGQHDEGGARQECDADCSGDGSCDE